MSIAVHQVLADRASLWKRLLVTTSVASLLAFAQTVPEFSGVSQTAAQTLTEAELTSEPAPSEDQLFLESDTLTYDNDRALVIATGNVQIAYGDYSLVADKVEYDQVSGRLLAIGSVEIVEPDGNRIFAREIDITDDFRDGFVSALNVATADNTRIAAESAERVGGETTEFNNGVYTACPKCKKDPKKPPLWQIRAKKVIIDNETRSVKYEDARFELFGKPIAWLPWFAHADPSVKRKSGFLFSQVTETKRLGTRANLGYFFNLAPNYDLTVYGSYYSRQGFLGEAEWRHRLANGEYSIRFAGINQEDPGAFSAGTVDRSEGQRHAIITRGKFDINERWQFGWNGLLQSDNNFARTYGIEGAAGGGFTNDVYLTGLGDKNYFDLRLQDFLVQDQSLDFDPNTPGAQTYTTQQATVLPSLDYNAVSGEEFSLGQLSLNVNIASVERDTFQIANFDRTNAIQANERFTGIQGNTNRISAEVEWKRSEIVSGAVVTGELSYRGDAVYQDTDNLNTSLNPLISNQSIYRSMPAAGIEIRYPLIAQNGSVSQVFEPIAQIFSRPDEKHVGKFANEDAQSFVFDASNLFERDKFSGYDRVEGGTRANIGFRYSASFESGATIDVVAGQSFHLDGKNSYADMNDLVNVGQESGLETDRSDYVASLAVNDGDGLAAGVAIRLDESDLGLKRSEVSSSYTQDYYSVSGSYVFADAQPNYRFNRDRHELRGSASIKLDDNWRAFGGLAYDVVTEQIFSESVGIAYTDDCFSVALTYSNSNDIFTGDSTGSSINFSIGLRTIGGFQRSFGVNE